MSTSKPQQPPAPAPAPSSYTRFIPREELGDFAAWNPTAFEQPPAGHAPADVGLRKPTLSERAAADVQSRRAAAQQTADLGKALRDAAAAMGGAKPAAPPAPPRAAPAGAAKPAPTKPAPAAAKPAPRRPVIGGVPGEMGAQAAEAEPAAAAPEPAAPPPVPVEELLREARQSAYQEGYRNGLAALESYKQTQSAQMASYMSDQIGMLASDFHQRLEALEQQLAGRIAGVALELARQVVRSELTTNPEMVVDVAEEALGTLLTSARHVVLRLNPDDQAMAQAQLSDVLAARGVRVVADAALTRGGCQLESDIAVVDATVEARWDRAAACVGHMAPWNGGHEAHHDTTIASLAERMEAAADAQAERTPTAEEAEADLAPEDQP
ncbi:MAG: hypothetical protein RI907_2017 [Pseudomonadota bacterium]|jgi:flagellar assembly protein FliH